MNIHRLRSLRESKKISQGEAAKRMWIVRTTYSNYEAGNREPDNYTLKILSDFYDVTTDYLLGVDENKIEASTEDPLLTEIRNMSDKQKEKLRRVIEIMKEE